MILDEIKNMKTYAALSPALEQAAIFLERCEKEALPAGTYEIDGKNVYALVIEYESAEKAAPFYESHDLYLDIQCMLRGSEYQWYAPRDTLTVSTLYSPEKDITKYHFEGQGNRIELAEGSFAIYYPQDGHLPGMPKVEKQKCKRVVVKVKC